MRFSLSQHLEENAVVALLACVCSITPDLIYSLSYHETDAGFRIWYPAIFICSGPQKTLYVDVTADRKRT
jgi:hypothetical protein